MNRPKPLYIDRAADLRYRIAHAAAMDEANRHAQAEGRSHWTKQDYQLACATFDRLLGNQDECHIQNMTNVTCLT